MATRQGPGGGDIELTWADPGTPVSNVWWVESKEDIDRAREVNSPSPAVPLCVGSPTPRCYAGGAVTLSPPVWFLQVRAACGAGQEGP